MSRYMLINLILLTLTTLPSLNTAQPLQPTQVIPPPLIPKKKCIGKGTKKPLAKGTKAPHLKTKAPLAKGTKVPTSKGSLERCDDGSPSAAPSRSPSESPSISVSPSLSPSKTPSIPPSDRPSAFPSFAPSISHKPSISQKPSISAIPSFAPSQNFSSWCFIDSEDEVPTIGEATNGTYYYEMVYDTNKDLSTLLGSLDKSILQMLFEEFVRCPKKIVTRTLKSDTNSGKSRVGTGVKKTITNNMRSLLIDSMDLNGADSKVGKCSNIAASKRDEDCNTFQGSFTLYVRDTMNPAEAQIQTLRFLQEQMNDGTFASKVDGVNKLYYRTAIDGREASNPDLLSLNQPVASAALSAVGVLLIATGSIVTILFVFAATRRREHYKVERMEEVFEEEESLFGKGIGLEELDNETDLMSNDSWKQRRNVMILGDDDSDYGLHGTRGKGLGRRGDDAVNVHQCTSATCQICSGQRLVDPTFIKSIYPDSDIMSHTASRQYSAPDTVIM